MVGRGWKRVFQKNGAKSHLQKMLLIWGWDSVPGAWNSRPQKPKTKVILYKENFMGQWTAICPACCPSAPFLVFQQAINYVPHTGLALQVPHLTFRALSLSSAVTGKAADFSMYYLVNKAFLSARLLCTSDPSADC